MHEHHTHHNDQSTVVAIDISGPLKIKPGEIIKYLKVKISDTVQEHGLLADKKSLLGKTEIKSPVAGTVTNIDTENGTVVIDSASSAPEVVESQPEQASLEGNESPQLENHEHPSMHTVPEDQDPEVEVEESSDLPDELIHKGKKKEKKFSRAVTKHKIKAIAGFGVGKGVGEEVKDLERLELDPSFAGKILLSEGLPSKLVMYKASAIGIEAFVVCGVKRDEIEDYKKEFAGKAQIAMLLVPKEMDLKKLDGVELEIKDEHLIVTI